MSIPSEKANSWTFREVGLLCQCADWKTYEEASAALYRIQTKSATTDDILGELRPRFSRLVDVFSSGIAQEFKIRPHQRLLAISYLEGEEIQKQLGDEAAQGVIPVPGDPFGKFSRNELFLHVRRNARKEQLSTKEGLANFQMEFNTMSPGDSWGDLVAQHPKEFTEIRLTENQLKAAQHFLKHRDVQLQAIHEVEAVMVASDPFW